MQTRTEAPRGLAANPSANTPDADGEGEHNGVAGKPELSEPDNSSAALATVRTANTFFNSFFLGLRLANTGRVGQIAKARTELNQLAELDHEISEQNQRMLRSITDVQPSAS